MASSLKKEPSEERVKMEEEEDQWPVTLRRPGYGQTLSDPETSSNSGSEGEGNEVGQNSFGILSWGRPVRLVIYDRHQEDNTRTIWIDFKSTYSDIANELTEIVANRTFVMLAPIWGPLPCWVEANPNSLIGTTCHTLYVVLESESVGYTLGVVRTSLSDYPIAIYDGPLDPSATVSEAVVASHPKLSDQIKSITGFTDDQIIKDTQSGYDSLRQYASSGASVVIMTVDETPTHFMSDLPDESIPPLLQVSFAYCKCLMQWGHDQDFFALQIIHLLRAILHTIISLALRMEKFFEEDTPDIETTLHAEDDMTDILRVAPLLSHELQILLRKLNGIMEALGGGHFDADDIQTRLDKAFDAVCADYPGAVTTRRSYGLFKRLGRIDHEEMQIKPPRDGADQPVPNPKMGKIEERLEESKIEEDTPMQDQSVAEYFNPSLRHWNQQAYQFSQIPSFDYAGLYTGTYLQNAANSASSHHTPPPVNFPPVNSLGPNAVPEPGSFAWLSNCTMNLSPQQCLEVMSAYDRWRSDVERQILVVNMYCDWFKHQRRPKKEALLKFYRAKLAPSEVTSSVRGGKGGQGARGGAVGYICEWPGCTKFLGGRTDRVHEHALTHLNIKMFVCDAEICNASFLRQNELTRHLRSCTLRLPGANTAPTNALFLSVPFKGLQHFNLIHHHSSLPSSPIASTSRPASKRPRSQRSVRGVSADIPPSTSGNDSPDILPGASAENPTSSQA